MKTYIGKTFCDVYKLALTDLVYKPEYITTSRGYKTNENTDVTLVIEDITKNLFSNSFRGIPENYLRKELALYLSGRDDAQGFVEASPFWKSLKNTNGKINSAYGNLIFQPELEDGLSQFDWAYESLKADNGTRQAVMFFNRPRFQYLNNKDFVCTLNCIFHIRDNKLYMRTQMRSNDIRRGMQYDIPFFMLLQYLMFIQLKTTVYPDLNLGSYTHFASSLHLYHNLVDGQNDIELAKNMLEAEWHSKSFPLPGDASVIMSPIIKNISYGKIPIIKQSDSNYDFYHWLMR